MWFDVGLGVVGCAVVLAGVVLIANRYTSPVTGNPTGSRVSRRDPDRRDARDDLSLPAPSLRPLRVRVRRQPEAAELSGINTRRTVMLTFVYGRPGGGELRIQTARLELGGAPTSASRTSCTLLPRRSSSARSPAALARSGCGAGATITQSLRSGMVLSEDRLTVAGHRGWRRLAAAVAIDAALRSGTLQGGGRLLVVGFIVTAIVIQTGQRARRPHDDRRPDRSAARPVAGGTRPTRRAAGKHPCLLRRPHAVDGVSVDVYPARSWPLLEATRRQVSLIHALLVPAPGGLGEILINGGTGHHRLPPRRPEARDRDDLSVGSPSPTTSTRGQPCSSDARPHVHRRADDSAMASATATS